MKKIGWLVDVNIFSGLGSGSEKTDRFYVEEGIKRGHDINLITPEVPFNVNDYDLFVISNFSKFTKQAIEKVTDKPTVFFLHDYYPLCNHRLYYPKLEKCKTCPNREWIPIMQKSKLIVWLSPLHRDDWLFACPELEEHPYITVPSGIDPDNWKEDPNKDTQENTCCCANTLYEFKGREQALEYMNNHKAYKFYITGDNPNNVEIPDNAEFLGRVDNNKLKEIYQSSKNLFHIPNREPCSRVVIEYLLSNPKGKIIGNDRIGILSYDIYDSNGLISREKLKSLLREGPEKFWSRVEEL